MILVTLAVGGFNYTAKRPDIANPSIGRNSNGIYFLADHNLYTAGDKKIDGFARLGYTSGDVEQFKNSWGTGFVMSGFVPQRPDGQIGFAVAGNSNSDKYQAANAPLDNTETQYELTYSDMLTPWMSIQPDLQYTVNPGTDPTLKNAWTTGLRMSVNF